MSAPLSLGSVCSGYGGLDLAAAQVLDVRPAWVADSDPAAAVLARRFPGAPNLGDITVVDFGAVAPVEVLCAGFPCQDISNAGRRAGIEGSHSGVWRHVARAVRDLRPRLVFVENVSALLVRGMGTVLGDLAALGYDARWTCLRASDIGAPHRRERVFLSAWPADPQSARQQGERLPRRTPTGGRAAADPDRIGRHGDRPARQSPQRHAPRPGGATAHSPRIGQRDPADQTIPVPAGWHPRPQPCRGGVLPAAHPESDRRDQGRPRPAWQQGRPDASLSDGAARWGRYAPAVTRWEHHTGRTAPDPTEAGRAGRPRLAPRFVEWLMGLPDGWVTTIPDLTRNQQLRLLGNGVVPAQGAAALTALLTDPATGSEAA